MPTLVTSFIFFIVWVFQHGHVLFSQLARVSTYRVKLWCGVHVPVNYLESQIPYVYIRLMIECLVKPLGRIPESPPTLSFLGAVYVAHTSSFSQIVVHLHTRAGIRLGLSYVHNNLFQRKQVLALVRNCTHHPACRSRLCQPVTDIVQLLQQGDLPPQSVPILVGRHVLEVALIIWSNFIIRKTQCNWPTKLQS